MKKFILFLLIGLLGTTPLSAEENFCGSKEPHAIDQWFDKAMENKFSTLEMREVQAQHYQKWDAELNRVYKKLMTSLKPKEKELLKKAQKAWLDFFETEKTLLSQSIYQGGGTLAPLVLSSAATQMIKARACQLSQHWEAKNNPP